MDWLKRNFKLSEAPLNDFHFTGILPLKDVTSPIGRNGWSQGWKSTEVLNVQGEKAEEWSQYVNLLNHSTIKLSEQEDIIK